MVALLNFSFNNNSVDKSSVIELCDNEINILNNKFLIYDSKIFGDEMIELCDNNLNNKIIGVIYRFIKHTGDFDGIIVADIIDDDYFMSNKDSGLIVTVSGICKNISNKNVMTKINKFYIIKER